MISEIQNRLDPIVHQFTTGDFFAEVFKAKEEYFERAGVVYEDDPEFEQRMQLFLDWYIFDRDLPRFDLPPIQFNYRQNEKTWTEDERAIQKDMCSSVHSLFEMKRSALFSKDIIVQDLFSKKNYTVKDPQFRDAFARGDLFEARLIPYMGNYSFSNGFCFHPRETRSFILGEIQKIRHQDHSRHLKFILHLAGIKLKHTRFAHIDVSHIYSENSRF